MIPLDPRYAIALARPRDLPLLAAIERAGGTLLLGHAPPSIIAATTGEDVLRDAQVHGRLWVALADDVPVGFALVCMLAPGRPHLEELDVDPRHGRRGIGGALVRAACVWVARNGHADLTLTTFRHVRWNMPFYAGLGFEEVPAAALRPKLAAIVRDETRRGLDPATHVVMRYRVPRPRSDREGR